MNCGTFQVNDVRGLLCYRGKRKVCVHCQRDSAAQCDFPVGKTRTGRTKTCSRHLCKKHRQPGVTPNVDFCPEHFPIAKAAYERRQAIRREAANAAYERLQVLTGTHP